MVRSRHLRLPYLESEEEVYIRVTIYGGRGVSREGSD